MRLSILRAVTIAAGAAIALAACSSGGTVPPSSAAYNPMALNNANALLPLALKKCDTSPPQYEWILEGACTDVALKPAGSSFTLAKYEDISIKGVIGKNNLTSTQHVYIADALDKKDIKAYKGVAFPKDTSHKDVLFYAVAVNQSKDTIVPKYNGKPILQYVVTDAHGLGGSSCGASVYAKKGAKFFWEQLPITAKPKGDTVTISQYTVPKGFELPPLTPLYFAIYC
jgi:hypothetical protein